ncbi:glycosyltransferase [Priestia megaterium]|uniref:glycosyltransferase n=1 Tax=Priestia megaterium TaxID=1404 RepID=UPI0022B8B8CB|nr:glycosyltransferase [Priestia megaterium]MCZ8493375.1 glycosyltransferase [Priestia megaterium]
MDKKLSIIVPVYNLEKFVSKCLDSILCQINDESEIIIINDGSTDTSPQIIDEYCMKHSNIKAIHKDNEGISKTRNRGVLEAAGEYVLFVDSDDYIAPNMVELMLNQAHRKNADIVISKAVNEWPEGRIEPMFQKSFDEDEVISGTEAIRRFWAGEINGHPWNKMVRRELMLKHNIFFPEDKRIYEDAPMFFNLYLKAERISFVDENLYYYVQHAASLTKKPKQSMLDDHADMLNSMESNIDKTYFTDSFKKEYQYFLLKQVYYHIDLLNQLTFADKKVLRYYQKMINRYIGRIGFTNLFFNNNFESKGDKVRLLLVKTRLCYLLKYRYRS